MHNLRLVICLRVLSFVMLGFLGTSLASADTTSLSSKDEKQIVGVVKAQLNAFAKDDSAKAFSYAAPNIKSLLGSAEQFMEMVRTQYAVIYRPGSTIFMRPQGHYGEAVLQIRLTDDKGAPWTALYTLQKQKNNAWLITGCTVEVSRGTTI